MANEPKLPQAIMWGAPVVALLAVIAAVTINWAESSREQVPVIASVPEFTLTDMTGQSFGRNDLNGKLHLVNFIFTRCPGICPRMNHEVKQLYDLYRGSEKIAFVSITVDPEYDTPEVLRRYADSVGVNDGSWKFLRGPIEDVRKLIEQGFLFDASELPAAHPARLVLVDQFGQIRGYYTYDDEAEEALLKQQIRQLARSL